MDVPDLLRSVSNIFRDVKFFCQKKWYEVYCRQHVLVLHHNRVDGGGVIQARWLVDEVIVAIDFECARFLRNGVMREVLVALG